jgi:hypothetical protein
MFTLGEVAFILLIGAGAGIFTGTVGGGIVQDRRTGRRYIKLL